MGFWEKGGDKVAKKTLGGYSNVFADIANVLLFNGRRLISPMYWNRKSDKGR